MNAMHPTSPRPARRGSARSHLLVAGLTATLAACGGGAAVALAVISPLAGDWVRTTGGPDERLSFNTPDGYLLQERVDVTGTISTSSGPCQGDATAVEGFVDDGDVQLFLDGSQRRTRCLVGRFVDLRRIDTEALGSEPARRYLNSRVDVQLGRGIWVDADDEDRRYHFKSPLSVNNDTTEPVEGCDVSTGSARATFEGTMTGFKVASSTPPSIGEIKLQGTGQRVFRSAVYRDGARIEAVADDGRKVTLERREVPADLAPEDLDCT